MKRRLNVVSEIGDGVGERQLECILHCPDASLLVIKIGRLGPAWGNEPTAHPLINFPLKMNNITFSNQLEMKWL